MIKIPLEWLERAYFEGLQKLKSIFMATFCIIFLKNCMKNLVLYY